MKKTKRWLIVLLVCCLIVGTMPTSALDVSEIASGTCGENMTWVLESNGQLTIKGTGRMNSYAYSSSYEWYYAPWYSLRKNITTVVIENGVANIGSAAFSGCVNLIDISIPDSITSIGGYAFYCCGNLKSIRLPNNIEEMGYAAFEGCNSLLSAGPIGSGSNMEFGWTTEIPEYAFSCSSIQMIDVPYGITSIGREAFTYCSSLTTVTLPHSITHIGDSAFESSGLTEIIIPDSVVSIDSCAFNFCHNLTHVVIPSSVSFCGDGGWMLGHCSKLLSAGPIGGNYDVEFGWTTEIPDHAFSGMGDDGLYGGAGGLSSVTLPDTITKIGVSAFEDCTELKTINIPLNVTSIGDSGFRNCRSLKTIKIPGGVSTIDEWVFYDCTKLENVVISSGVQHLKRNSFGFTNLSSFFLPISIKKIDGAFSLTHFTDVYYEGAESDWNKIEIAYGGNDALETATIHYNSASPFPEDSFTVYYLSGHNTATRQLTFGDPAHLSPYTYTLADGVNASGMDQLLNKYVLVTAQQQGDSLFDYTVTDIQPVTSAMGTVTATGEHSLTIDGTEYPVREDWLLAVSVGDEILYHTHNGTIMGYSALEEKHGILEGWDNTTKRVTIDGVEYPTNHLTDLSFLANLDEYLQKGVYFVTSGSMDYCPLLKITGFYYPGGKLEDFDADIYHAKWLAKGGNGADTLQNDTPSQILIQNIEENNGDIAIDLWRSFELVFNTLDDVSTLYDFAVEPKDMYSALILDALEASVSYDVVASEYEDGLKISRQLISDVKSTMKANHGIDLADDLAFQQATAGNSAEIEKCVSDWFKTNQPDLADMDKSFKWISKGLKTVGGIEDFAEYCASCYALSQVSESMKAVLQRAYEKSVSVYGPLDNMTLAFRDCIEVVNTGVDDMWQRIGMEGVTVVGEGFAKYLVKEVLWSHITSAISAKCPEVAILQVGYSAGKTISNWLCDTDDSVEQYLKMDYVTDIESLVDGVYNDLRIDFYQNPSKELAQAYLSAMQLSFQLRGVDSETAYKYVDIVDDALLSKLEQAFGKKGYEELKESIQFYHDDYAGNYANAQTSWVPYLEEDYPGSGLYQKYEHLTEAANLTKLAKEIKAACPVNVYVYDQSDNMVASVVDGRVSCDADDVMIALLGDEKIIRFYGNANYRVKYAGYDSGDMDVTISEFGEDENTVRTVSYYDVPLTQQTTYALVAENEAMKPYALEEISDGTAVKHDYDSMDNTVAHTIQAISGTLEQNGEIFAETTAQKGEALILSAYVPEGCQFVRWEVSAGDAVIKDSASAHTELIMGSENSVVTAIITGTQDPPAAPELKSKTSSSVTLKTIAPNANGAAVEYSKDSGATWQSSPTFTGLTADTRYSFVARYGQTASFKASPASAILKVTTDAASSGGGSTGGGSSGGGGSFGGGGSSGGGTSAAGSPSANVPAKWQNPYSDVDEDAWYYDAVKYVTENSLMSGYGNGKFGPGDILSRAQLAQILYNKEGKPWAGSCPFKDIVSTDWYARAVAWASENGIVNGYENGNFGPGDSITREQLAVMLWRYAGSPESGAILDRFIDGGKTSSWATAALRWAVEQGIVTGKGNGILDPVGQATRAEVATMIQRFLALK